MSPQARQARPATEHVTTSTGVSRYHMLHRPRLVYVALHGFSGAVWYCTDYSTVTARGYSRSRADGTQGREDTIG